MSVARSTCDSRSLRGAEGLLRSLSGLHFTDHCGISRNGPCERTPMRRTTTITESKTAPEAAVTMVSRVGVPFNLNVCSQFGRKRTACPDRDSIKDRTDQAKAIAQAVPFRYVRTLRVESSSIIDTFHNNGRRVGGTSRMVLLELRRTSKKQ